MPSASNNNRPSDSREERVETEIPDEDVSVVAIGASSGGINALEGFLRNMPSECGMAFVLAMHLSPEHESRLAPILQKFTAMPVKQVSTAVDVAPDHVYVIAPDQRLSLENGRLHVAPADVRRN